MHTCRWRRRKDSKVHGHGMAWPTRTPCSGARGERERARDLSSTVVKEVRGAKSVAFCRVALEADLCAYEVVLRYERCRAASSRIRSPISSHRVIDLGQSQALQATYMLSSATPPTVLHHHQRITMLGTCSKPKDLHPTPQHVVDLGSQAVSLLSSSLTVGSCGWHVYTDVLWPS